MEMLIFEVSAVRNTDHASRLSAHEVELEIDSGISARSVGLRPVSSRLIQDLWSFKIWLRNYKHRLVATYSPRITWSSG